MNPQYYDAMTILSTGGLGTVGADLFGGEWGDVDAQVLCLNGVGVPSEHKELYEEAGLQIMVRGEKRGNPDSRDIDVYQRAKSVSDYLLSLPEVNCVNDTFYTGFEESSNIAPLGRDDNERFIYSLNFTVYRNRS